MNIFNKIGRLSWPLMFVAVVLFSQVCGADEYVRRDDDEPCPDRLCPPPHHLRHITPSSGLI